MVQRVANPYMLQIMINLFAYCEPRNQILVLKVIQNLLELGIPPELFDDTVQTLNERHKILEQDFKYFKFESQFLKYFIAELYRIRKAMFSETAVASTGAYEVSQEIARLLQSI